MKKIIIKIITILIAFIAGLVFMSFLFNKGNLDMTAEMPEATLPVLYMIDGETYTNPLYGYTSETNASCVRNTVTLLGEDRILSVAIEKYNADIERMSYEIRSMDMERLVQDGTLETQEVSGQYLKTSFKVKDLLESGKEYLLVLHVTTKNFEDVKYFERIIDNDICRVRECTEFATEFHNATLDPETAYPVTQYLEADNSTAGESFERVTINSKYRTVMWDEMAVTQTEEPQISYLEFENEITSLKMNYEVSHVNEAGETETYAVQDYFRIRYTESRMYLLDYVRTADRVFDRDVDVFGDQTLKTGIQSESVEYMENDEGNVVNFVILGELWSYDSAQNRLIKVYSFKNGADRRGRNDSHGIRIINIDDSGSMDFAVIGYMNRGTHEGETGVDILRYDSLANTVEELLFVKSSQCYDVIKESIGALLYISHDDVLYLSYENQIYAIDLVSGSRELLAENLSADCYIISGEGKMIAWQDENEEYSSRNLTTINLETGTRHQYSCGSDEYIKPLGFMDTDFIYGVARASDVSRDFAGNTVFPMYQVSIMNDSGDVVRDFDYASKNKYVTGAAVVNNRIELSCVSKNAEGSYDNALAEPITSNAEEKISRIVLSKEKDAVKRLEYVFTFQEQLSDKRMKILNPKEVIFEGSRDVDLGTETDSTDVYFVYGQAKMQGMYGTIREAVQSAYSCMGVVVDEKMNVLWRRGERKTRSVLALADGREPYAGSGSLQASLAALLEEEGSFTDAENELAEGKSVLEILSENSRRTPCDLTGCSLSMVLYYVSEGQPVLAMTDAASAELIVGYDAQNVYILDALSGQVHKEGQSDAGNRFDSLGNVFIGLME